MGHLLGIGIEGEVLRHLPDEDLAIVGSGGNDSVIEGVPLWQKGQTEVVQGQAHVRVSPVGVQDGGSVAAEQGYLVGELSALIEGYDCECASTAGVPIDSEILGVGLL